MMPIDHIQDWERRLARQDAFWDCAILDRPVLCIACPKPEPVCPWPAPKPYAAMRDRWFDAERAASEAVAHVRNTDYFGDALPATFPNLGPEVFSSFFGMEMDYTLDTSWGIPNLHDWAEVGKLVFSRDNFYWRKLEEMTDALLAACKGLCYIGVTDLHPGGDALAAFRDPQELNMDMLLHPDEVKGLLKRVEVAHFETFDYWCDRLMGGAGQACANWAGIVSSKRWYVPSNDFSCMVSKEMFDDVFLPGIVAECRHYEASIYHLDGPDALRHLDSLLEIKELNAIQWVFGAGRGRAVDWLPVYRRCQDAGKGIQIIGAGMDELDTLMANLRPEGVWMSMGLRSADEADAALKKVAAWR